MLIAPYSRVVGVANAKRVELRIQLFPVRASELGVKNGMKTV